jgi:hypothetical protein
MKAIGHNTSKKSVHGHGGDQGLAKSLPLVVNRLREINIFIATLLNPSFIFYLLSET